MPTFRSFAEFGREWDKLNRELETDARRKIARKMAEHAEKIAVQEASRDLGGDPEFSGWKGRSLADLQIKDGRRGDAVWLFPTRKSGGPWKVTEQGRNQGDAKARGGGATFFGPLVDRRQGTSLTLPSATGRQRKLRKGYAKRWNGYTRGKGTASRAVARFERELPPIAERGVKLVTSKHFDVT